VVKTKLFDILAERGHKQRWLLGQLRERGYRFSETYLSQVKSGLKAPSRRFIEAVSATLGLPERELFETKEHKARESATDPESPTFPAARLRSCTFGTLLLGSGTTPAHRHPIEY